MAKQVVTTLIDHINGSEATESMTFSYRGAVYSIDLNEKDAAAFGKAVSKYIGHATCKATPRRPATKAAAGSTGRRSDLSDVRTWASANGYEVSSRGRVAGEILDPYDAAN